MKRRVSAVFFLIKLAAQVWPNSRPDQHRLGMGYDIHVVDVLLLVYPGTDSVQRKTCLQAQLYGITNQSWGLRTTGKSTNQGTSTALEDATVKLLLLICCSEVPWTPTQEFRVRLLPFGLALHRVTEANNLQIYVVRPKIMNLRNVNWKEYQRVHKQMLTRNQDQRVAVYSKVVNVCPAEPIGLIRAAAASPSCRLQCPRRC